VPDAAPHYICDADATRAKSVADATGAQNVAFNPMAVINDKNVDAVVIAAFDQFHNPLTIACIETVLELHYLGLQQWRNLVARFLLSPALERL
jgi:Oxidoreductase family, NAD-binding Rossmann fold